MLALKPVGRDEGSKFNTRLDFYLFAIEREFRAKSEDLQIRFLLQRCTHEQFSRENAMLWAIFDLADTSYSAQLFDVPYYEELALRYSFLQQLKNERTGTNVTDTEWETWLYATQNESAIPVRSVVYTTWLRSIVPEPASKKKFFKSKHPAFKRYRIKTERFHYRDPGGRLWQTSELRAALANWTTYDSRWEHLKTLLKMHFDCPLECQMGRCALGTGFCPSVCHRIGLPRLWVRCPVASKVKRKSA